jgi:hypothetical protein
MVSPIMSRAECYVVESGRVNEAEDRDSGERISITVGCVHNQTGVLVMNSMRLIGFALLLLGVLALVVPVPQRESHSVKIGDTRIGVQTQHSEKMPAGVGIVLLAGGVLALVLGSRKS